MIFEAGEAVLVPDSLLQLLQPRNLSGTISKECSFLNYGSGLLTLTCLQYAFLQE